MKHSPPCQSSLIGDALLPKSQGERCQCRTCGTWTHVCYDPTTPDILPHLAPHRTGGIGSRRKAKGGR
jgi:hypothetical protein